MYHELNQLIQPVTCKYFYAALITQGCRRRAGGDLGGAVDWEPGRACSNMALPKDKVLLHYYFLIIIPWKKLKFQHSVKKTAMDFFLQPGEVSSMAPLATLLPARRA